MPYLEGTIGAGKSTFLRLLLQALESRLPVVTIQEPVQKWVDVGILQAFYENPKENAYKFQTYTFLTRWKALKEGNSSSADTIRIVERSIFSDRYVFAEALHESGLISDMEWAMYVEWWESLCELEREVGPRDNKFIYLRADPETAYARMKKRARDGEAGVSIEYLRENVERHDRWLLALPTERVLIIDVNSDFEEHPEVFQSHVEKVIEFLKEA